MIGEMALRVRLPIWAVIFSDGRIRVFLLFQ
jgi:hypothetical protein